MLNLLKKWVKFFLAIKYSLDCQQQPEKNIGKEPQYRIQE